MKIVNATKNTTLAEKAIFVENIFARMKGLLGLSELKQGKAIILKPCNSIHTFFMRFPIDVLFLDKENKVVEAISSVKPYRISKIYFNAKSAVELPSGVIKSSSTEKGDYLEVK